MPYLADTNILTLSVGDFQRYAEVTAVHPQAVPPPPPSPPAGR